MYAGVRFEANPVLWNNEAVNTETLRNRTDSQPGDSTASAMEGRPVEVTSVPNPLSEREMDVAVLLVTGATNNEIAERLVISPHTVKVHLRNIYEKLEVNTRTEASTLLLQKRWVALSGVEPAAPVTDPVPAAIPDAEPLADIVGPIFAWQPYYLLAAIALAVSLLFLPPLIGQGATPASNLLSDSASMAQAQPVVNVYPRWELRTPLPAARSRFALISPGDNNLYAIGGEGAQGQILANVVAYNLIVNEWRPVAPLPQPLSNMAATTWNGEIYVAGGATDNTADNTSGNAADNATGETDSLTITNGLWRYSVGENLWQQIGVLPASLAGASLVAADDALYLLGGWDGQQMYNQVWRLPLDIDDPDADNPVTASQWEVVAELPVARAFGGAVVVNDAIFVAGGYDGRRELDFAQRYLFAEGKWQELPPLSTPRGGIQVLYDGLAVFVIGGGWQQPVNTLERFDPALGMWSHFPSPIEGEWRNLGASASESGYLYLLGGWSGGYLTTHMQYQSSFRTFLPSTRNTDDGG
jgi:DNA-binding CsgD family transcriptional regulator